VLRRSAPIGAVLLCLSGCASEPAAPESDLSTTALIAAPPPQAIAALFPLGLIPYDGRVLPLISPGADFAATHFGAAPSWGQLLGAPGSGAPEFTAVRVYTLSERGARATATVADAVLLGRGADREGFLVEAPRPDGSRWIGRVPWPARGFPEPSWLVADDQVNAFATLAGDGTLAWSSRSRSEHEYSVRLRREERQAIVPRRADESWLLPTFSADGSRLFALVLRGRELHVTATAVEALEWETLSESTQPPRIVAPTTEGQGEEQAIRASELRPGERVVEPAAAGVLEHPLARDATVELAWQTLAFAQGWPVEAVRPADALLLFHPQERRLALWHADRRSLSLLPTGSHSGTFLDEQTLVLGLTTRAVVQSLLLAPDGRIGTPPRPLAMGVHIPRSTRNDSMPLVLLSPQRGSISVAGVRVAPPGSTATAEAAR
jgi:hypothetical protein